LIRLSLVLPAVVAGAPSAVEKRLDRLAALWGLAYQILDDFKDCLLSSDEAGKSTCRDVRLAHPNLPVATGATAAREELLQLLSRAREVLKVRQDPGGAHSNSAVVSTAFPALRIVQEFLEDAAADVARRLDGDRSPGSVASA
jgi:geranylgeranyl pyrophosphate synthase